MSEDCHDSGTKGVEDGISDEQCPGCRFVNRNHWRDCPVRLRLKKHYAALDAAAVPEAPTFAYELAMYLTRNGADAPHMQAEINMFLYENGWKTMQKGSK